MANWDLFLHLTKISNGELPFTWEEFRKLGFLFNQLKRSVRTVKCYRGNFIKSDDKRLNLKTRFGYPPKDITLKGRCNLQGYPVLYCSNSFLTAIQETIISKMPLDYLKDYKNIMYISEWEMKESAPVRYLDFNNAHMPKNEDYEFYRLYFLVLREVFLSKKGHDISSNISNLFMYGNEVPNELGKTRLLDFDNELWKFIFYPSVVNDRKSVNVAVHPELVDKNTFALNKVLKIQLNPMTVDELLNSPKIEFGILEVGDVIGKNDELISWREPVGTDYNYI